MIKMIEKVQEAERLLLVWRPPFAVKKRSHWAVGEVRKVSDKALSFRYFHDDNEFQQINRQEGSLVTLRERAFDGYPAFSWEEGERVDGVLEAFMRRVPSFSRTDFDDYLAQYRLAPELKAYFKEHPFALLGRSGAVTPNDSFKLIDPLENLTPPAQFVLEVMGVRHHQENFEKDPLQKGEALSIERDFENEFDCHAVKVVRRRDHQILGHVCRFQAASIGKFLEHAVSIKAEISRLNGTKSDPKLYMLVSFGEDEG